MTTKKTKKLVKSRITWPRILGLLQTDGNFYFSVDADKTVRPKVTITVTKKRPEFIMDIINFLKSNGLSVQSTNINNNNSDRGFNISIERIENCTLLFSKLEALECGPNPVSLVGKKKEAFELLKQVLILCKKPRSEEVKKQLVDLKSKLRNITTKTIKDPSLNVKDIEDEVVLVNRLGLPNNTVWKGAASNICQVIEQSTLAATQMMINQSKSFNGCAGIYPEYAEFISGVWDGDGSFQVSIKVHQTKDGGPVIVKPKNKSPWSRRFIEIKPEMTLTDFKTLDKNPLFEICNNLFYPEQIIKPMDVGQGKNANRIYIKSIKALSTNALPLFERFAPSYKRALNRFRIMRLVINNNKLLLKSAKYNRCLIKMLFESPDFGSDTRPYELSTYLDLIEKQFNK